jgi:hypothetical protein
VSTPIADGMIGRDRLTGKRGFALGVLLGACSFDSGGVVSGGALGSTGAEDDDSASDSGSTSASATVSESQSQSGSTSADDSASADSTSIGGDVTESEGGDSTGGVGPQHLQHGPHTTCTEPLWCYSGTPDVSSGGRHAGQECFTSPIPAPFQITSIDYIVGGVAPQLAGFILEVYSVNVDEPGQLLTQFNASAAEATEGPHVFVPPALLVIPEDKFCVGFRTVDDGLGGGLGFAVDEDSLLGATSYGAAACGIGQWTDTIDDVLSDPRGNWCVGVDVAPM